jgi:flagellar biosynthesis protein FlhF
MQLSKYHGRTIRGILARVRRELGDDAMILETRTLEPGSPEARMNPGARYEVLAVREAPRGHGPALPRIRSAKPQAAGRPPSAAAALKAYQSAATEPPVTASAPSPRAVAVPARHPESETPVAAPSALLDDLAMVRAQIRDLLDDGISEDQLARARVDLTDYRGLIEQGIDHRILAPHFRNWLQWRTASPALRNYMRSGDADGSIARMQGDSLREWLWHAWCRQQQLAAGDPLAHWSSTPPNPAKGPKIVGLLGASGVGKTTTLAKVASKLRQENRQNIAVVSLDTRRFGAVEQIRRLAKLLGVTLHEVVTQEDLRRSMETWARFDWVGIDTPGAMDPASPAGDIYGSILAQNHPVRSLLVLPATQNESVSRRQIQQARDYQAQGFIFAKLDENPRSGALLNLTMDTAMKIDSLSTGLRVPDDWHPASPATLWDRVLAPEIAAASESRSESTPPVVGAAS